MQELREIVVPPSDETPDWARTAAADIPESVKNAGAAFHDLEMAGRIAHDKSLPALYMALELGEFVTDEGRKYAEMLHDAILLKLCSEAKEPGMFTDAMEANLFLTGPGELLAGRLHDHIQLVPLVDSGANSQALRDHLEPVFGGFYTRDGRRAFEYAHDRALYDEVRHSRDATSQAIDEGKFISAYWRDQASSLFE